MNKTAIKNFAVWARLNLIEAVRQKAYEYGICDGVESAASADTVGGRVLSKTEMEQRGKLISQIKAKGYTQVMEEAAYTWFNRFIALRYMEVNGFLPSKVRVFSDESGAFKPDILSEAMTIELDGLDREKVFKLLDRQDNEGLYKYLIITQCNALGKCLPGMFERIEDYTELLFPNNLLKPDSVIGRMISDIPEKDWTDAVQIIGWLYQYYNAGKKDEVFANLKKNVKITKENIPAATQLFTPDWIVRYMVENSLGRLWVDGHSNEELKANWKYYLEEAEQEPSVQATLAEIHKTYAAINPEDIRIIDPCMGSGHILVYTFDILMQIYTSSGWSERDAAQSILQNNLYGLDIDDRAAQLAYFAVMMKARQYDRRIFSRGIQPHVCVIMESNDLSEQWAAGNAQMQRLFDCMKDAKEYGSIIHVPELDFNALRTSLTVNRHSLTAAQLSMADVAMEEQREQVQALIDTAEVLAGKYHVVITNPPYMGSGSMDTKLSNFVMKHYPDSKSDLFAVFIERCGMLTAKSAYQAMITQHAWMFLSSFEKLRGKLLQKDTVNMAHLGPRAFEEIGGEVVQTTSFVLRGNHIANYKGTYCRLIEPTTQQGKEDMFLSGENRCNAQQSNFSKIPGSPVAYWLSNKIFELYENGQTMEMVAHPKVGMQTSNNDKYLRLWFEIVYPDFSSNPHGIKWIKYLKGGAHRKWYGNLEYLLWYNYSPDFILKQKNARVLDISFLKKKKCTWTDLTSGNNSFRLAPDDTFYDISGHCFFPAEKDQYWLLAYANTSIFSMLKKVFNSTFHCQVGDVAKIVVPVLNGSEKEHITLLSKECVSLSRTDWDSFETSWDFKKHPLV